MRIFVGFVLPAILLLILVVVSGDANFYIGKKSHSLSGPIVLMILGCIVLYAWVWK